MNRPVAAIEIGSGALKIVVADDSGIKRHRITTDLISVLDGGSLPPDAKGRLSAKLDEAARLVENIAPARRRVVATHALRAGPAGDGASNLAELVASAFGVEMELLSEEREAELAYRAIEVDPSPVMIDIGYGSTELAVRLSDGTLESISVPIGAATITDQYLSSDPPRAAELSAALSVIELYLDDIARERPRLVSGILDGQIVGLGAIRFIAEVELGAASGDDIDGYRLEWAAAEELFRAVATEARIDRSANPGLNAEHVDLIVGALCVLLEFMRRFGVDQVVVSVRGVVDGVVAEMVSGEQGTRQEQA